MSSCLSPRLVILAGPPPFVCAAEDADEAAVLRFANRETGAGYVNAERREPCLQNKGRFHWSLV